MDALFLTHALADRLVISNFVQHDWWLHFVVHTVMFVAPAGLILIFSFWLARALYGRFQQSRQSRLSSPTPSPGPQSLEIVPGVFRYILMHTRRNQFLLLGVSLLAMPLLYATLELPKLIINEAIDSHHFPILFLGRNLTQVDYLLLLCGVYILAVAFHGALKYGINVYKGYVGERLLRRLRLMVYRRARRSDTPWMRAALIPVMTQEVEPVGGFASDAFVLPAFQGGTFLTVLAFILIQDPILGAAAVILLPLQLVIIPRLQRRITRLARVRVRQIRRLGTLIGDTSTSMYGGPAVRVLSIGKSIKKIQRIRIQLYQRKFFLKSLNNFIAHMTPFFFYSLGGYLVIQGNLSLGALVAVVAAYKDFSTPLRELFTYYQTTEDVRVRYEEIRRFLIEGSKSRAIESGPSLSKSEPRNAVSGVRAAVTA